MKGLRIEEHSPDGTRKPVGTLLSDNTVVGRDPGGSAGEPTLKVNRGSISRRHGVFFILGTHWCYKDLGSTNGSWFNGRQLQQNQPCLVRSGDRLQIADTFIAFSSSDQSGIKAWDEDGPKGGASLLVFESGVGVSEYRSAIVGKILDVGGPSSTIPLADYQSSSPYFSVESKDGDLFLSISELKNGESPTSVVSLNDRNVSGVIKLADRDEIRCGQLTIIVNLPPSLQVKRINSPQSISVPVREDSKVPPLVPESLAPQTDPHVLPSRLKPFEDEEGSSLRRRTTTAINTFGNLSGLDVEDSPDKMEQSISSRQANWSGKGEKGNPGLAPSLRRFNNDSSDSYVNDPSVKDRFYAAVGFLTVLGIIGLIVWFAFLSPDQKVSELKVEKTETPVQQ